MKRRFAAFVALALGGFFIFKPAPTFAIDAGVASVDVTPSEPIRLTGYGGRRTNNVGVEQKLWAKALALGSDREGPAVLLTLDNCGIADSTYRELVARLTKKARLKQAGIAIACSHTHSGPCTTDWAPNIFASDISPQQQDVIDRYTKELIGKLEDVALAALKDRRPARLSWSQGQVGFARNRRTVVGNTARFGDNAAGPVDQALPVLKVTDPDGKLRALVANYACHCTTLGGEYNHVCGDWAGYAQEAIEREHPGATALITIGCGADANPFPRGGADAGLALAKQHGEEINVEVKRLLGLTFTPLVGKLTTRFKEIQLPFGPHFTRDQWQARATNSGIVGYHARKWLARLDGGRDALPRVQADQQVGPTTFKPPDSLYYPISSWQFGDELALVFLPGEVVVDYALRLKREFDAQRLWVTAYANYVPCYIPSRRILAEGGYEAEDSLWYYDRPARISTNAEELIIKTVHELVPKSFLSDPKKAEFPDPKSPQQALRTIRTKAGFTVELVASEPLIESPVAIDWDARGRLWVCEMYDYPTGIPEQSGGSRRASGGSPLTPALSPSEGEREKGSAAVRQGDASGSSTRGRRSSLSPSEGERAGVRGQTQAAANANSLEGHVWGKNPPGTYKPGGRIKILTDVNGDGRYDKATLFLDKLAFPTGVFPWRNGALICAAPDILFAEDTDGDGRADVVRTNYTGFATHNYQARVNGFRWGLDGWLHGSSGLFGGKIKSLLTGKEVDLGGRDFRIRPDTGEIEPLAGISQMGRMRDDFDNWFGNDNSTLLWHYPLPDHYMRRNPYVTYPEPRVNVAANVRRLTSTRNSKPGTRNEDQSLLTSAATDPNKLYPISPTLERFNDPQAANRVTGACGPDIYRDNLLGAEYYGNAFICEPVHNLITRLVLEPDCVTFAGRRADDEQRGEFLASTDNWFRPVQVRTGPDGALWVVDMYRFVIEHPRWIAPERLKTLDARAGADMGRIYRVYPKGAKLRPIRDLTSLRGADLVKVLGSPNALQRDLADAQIRSRPQVGTNITFALAIDERSALAAIAMSNTLPACRVQALSLLAEGNALETVNMTARTRDADPRVRQLVLRSVESRLFTQSYGRLEHGLMYADKLGRDADERVRFQVALATGYAQQGGGAAALAESWRLDDPWVRAAVLSSAVKCPAELLAKLLDHPESELSDDVAERLVRIAVSVGDPALLRVLRTISKLDAPIAWPPYRHVAIVASFLNSTANREADWQEQLLRGGDEKLLVAQLKDFAQACRHALLIDSNEWVQGNPVTQRSKSYLRLLGHSSEMIEEDVERVCAWLQIPSVSQSRQEFLATLARLRTPSVASNALALWSKYLPATRESLVKLFLSRDEWTSQLLHAVSKGMVAVVEIRLSDRQLLVKHANTAIRDHAQSLFNTAVPLQRAEILSNYSSVGSLASQSIRGSALFDQNCSQCHAWRGHGHSVGPNLAEFAGKSVGDFVQAILDPNSAINANFLAYNVETKDGRSLSGIVRGETASGLTLVQGGGVQETILRSDVAEIRASNLSLMPEGLEQAMTPQDLADLIAWIKQAAPAPFGHASANPELATKNRADFLKSGANGIAKVNSGAEALPYRSWIGTLPMAFCRQSAGVNRLAWESTNPLTPALSPGGGEGERPPALSPGGVGRDALPRVQADRQVGPTSEGAREDADATGKRWITFRFPAAMGFLSQPSGKFTLRVNGAALLDFNVSLADETWQSPDGRARMSYSVTEANAEDSCGVLRIDLASDLVKHGEPARFEVIGSDSGSQRWFGIYDSSGVR